MKDFTGATLIPALLLFAHSAHACSGLIGGQTDNDHSRTVEWTAQSAHRVYGRPDGAKRIRFPLALPYFHILTKTLITHCSHHVLMFLGVWRYEYGFLTR